MPSKNANIKQYQSTYKKKLRTRTEDGEHEAGRRILIHILGHHIALFRSGDSSHFSEQLG